MRFCFHFFNRILKSPSIFIPLIALRNALPKAKRTPQAGREMLSLPVLAFCNVCADSSRSLFDMSAKGCRNQIVRIVWHDVFPDQLMRFQAHSLQVRRPLKR